MLLTQLFAALALATIPAGPQNGQAGAPGQLLPSDQIPPAVIETWDDFLVREAQRGEIDAYPRSRKGASGSWWVPKDRQRLKGFPAASEAHADSGPGLPAVGGNYLANSWGDASMGLGFGRDVELAGVWLSGQGGRSLWAESLQVVGYLAGEEVSRSAVQELDEERPTWLALDALTQVDRVVFLAKAQGTDEAGIGSAWFGLDGLTYRPIESSSTSDDAAPSWVELNFEDLRPGTKLESEFGLTWERGEGQFPQADPHRNEGVEAPQPVVQGPPSAGASKPLAPILAGPISPAGASSSGSSHALGAQATAPTVLSDFKAVERGDNGQFSFPPDTHGAVGANHFVVAVNRNFAVFSKQTGQKLQGVSLGSFQPGTSGDPRVLYDQYEDRWIVVSTDFSGSERIFLAYSLSNDPLGAWVKTSYFADQGSDSGCWPDFPTIGLDQRGIYIASNMIGCGVTLWAIDKAPLVSGSGLGAINVWRDVAFSGTLQPAHTYGDVDVEYLMATSLTSTLEVYNISGPITNPVLSSPLGIQVGQYFGAPNAAALGATPKLNTGDTRLSNLVVRDGLAYTSHTVVGSTGKASARWYEIVLSSNSVRQSGRIEDPSLHYFYPSIAVNAHGDIALGFSGSDENTSPGSYFAGRANSDPLGVMSTPQPYKTGNGGTYSLVDGSGRNRWGDYSFTSVDPTDDLTIWTVQEYLKGNNDWSTWIAELDIESTPPPKIYCEGKLNSVGFSAKIGWGGSTSVSNADFTLVCAQQIGIKPGLAFHGTGQAEIPFLGGTLCSNPPLVRGAVILSDTFGLFETNIAFQSGDEGTQRSYQWWYRDSDLNDGTGAALSDALDIFILP